MRKMALATILLSLGLPAAVRSQEPASDPVVGCYHLEIGPWEPALHPGIALRQTPPELIRISAEIGENVFERGRPLVRPLIPYGRTPSGYWERVEPDSIRVTWTNGFVGVRLRLRIEAQSLQGRAETFTDVRGEPPPPQAAVVAHRTTCRDGEPA